MLCFRRTCPFGLPDDADATEHITLLSVGYALRMATAHLAEAPLPAALAALLADLARHEHAARRSGSGSRRRRGPLDQPASPSAGGSAAVEMQVSV
jgi:hypothetical protein